MAMREQQPVDIFPMTPTPFWGEFPSHLENGGRLRVPATWFRVWLSVYPSPEIFLTILRRNELSMFPLQEWDKIEHEVQKIPDNIQGKRNFIMATNYFGADRILDSRGRFYIRHSRIRKELDWPCRTLRMIGAGTHIRIQAVCPT